MEKPKVLTARELRTIMPRWSGWKLARNKLSTTFEFQDFVQSLSFVNSLVAYFETVDHHPDGPYRVWRGHVRAHATTWRQGRGPRCRGREEDLLALQGAVVNTARLSSSSLGEGSRHQCQRAFLACLPLHFEPLPLHLVVRHEEMFDLRDEI